MSKPAITDREDLHDLADRAGVPHQLAEHFGPLVQLLLAALPEQALRAQPAAPVDLADAGFDLFRSYDAKEAAAVLGISRVGSLYEIDEVELPRSRVGPGGTAVRFFGLDLLCYMKRLPPVDYAAVRDEAEGALRRKPSGPVRTMPGVTGRRRVQ